MDKQLLFFWAIICIVPTIIHGLCSDNSHLYYPIPYHTADSSTLSSTHLAVSLAHCISICEGFVKHDPITQVCECYELPQTLTNVALASSQIWMSGRYPCSSVLVNFYMKLTLHIVVLHRSIAIISVVDLDILSVCDTSLVNGLGYAIDDSAITASSSFASENCEPQNARNIEGSSSSVNVWWCCGSGKSYRLIYVIMDKK